MHVCIDSGVEQGLVLLDLSVAAFCDCSKGLANGPSLFEHLSHTPCCILRARVHMLMGCYITTALYNYVVLSFRWLELQVEWYGTGRHRYRRCSGMNGHAASMEELIFGS